MANDNLIAIVDSSDNNKILMNRFSDYVNCSHWLDSDDEEPPTYKLVTRSNINLSLNTSYQGDANSFFLIDSRNNDYMHSGFSANPFPYLEVKFADILAKLETADFVSIALVDELSSIKFDTPSDNITQFLTVVYGYNGKIYKLEDDALVSRVYLTYAVAYSMNPFPGTCLLLNSSVLTTNGAWAEFNIPETNSIGRTIRYGSDQFKAELFQTTITSNIDAMIGNYKVLTREDTFSFTLFGSNTVNWASNGRIQRNTSMIDEIKAGIDVAALSTITSSLPTTISAAGEVSVDTSGLAAGSSAYVRVKVNLGDFITNHVVNTEKSKFEYVITKLDNESVVTNNADKSIVPVI